MAIRPIDDDDDDDGNSKSDLGMRMQNPMVAELEKLSNEINVEIERLNHEYNKFFGGAEKKPPVKMREELNKKAERLKTIMKSSTTLGTTLRVQNAVNKYNTHIAMWDKRLEKFERTGSSM